MDNKSKLLRRLIVLGAVLLLCGGVAAAGLFSLQIVNGAEYRVRAQSLKTSTVPVTASRGEILDRYGRPLVTNRSVFSLRIDYVYWDREVQNETILKLAGLIRANGSVIEEQLPISQEPPFAYTGGPEDKARKALEKYAEETKGFETGLTAEQMIAAMREKYGIDPSYSDADARTIAGVRYEMIQNGFSPALPFVISHDVSMDLVSQIKERHDEFVGVAIEVEPIREYKTTAAAHILGRVGQVWAEEYWAKYGNESYETKEGYNMNTRVGKDGAEKAFEEYLHGINGTRSVETDIEGNITNEISADPPQPGDNCILTIDLALQEATEKALATRIDAIPTATAGAAVVIQVGTGEILAMASYPTYNLETFNKDYDQMRVDPLKPMINRAIMGLYAPGSTFKPMTAIAALEEGAITPGFTQVCNHTYEYLGQVFKCTGWHGRCDVVRGIQKSCNVFFYETGRRLGAEKLESWAKQFGLGEKTGIELAGEYSGYVAGPENRARMLETMPYLNSWMPGDTVQAAIGQSDSGFTPLQIANFIATIASGGKHYQAHILKSVKSYDYSETIKDDTPVLLNTVPISDNTLELVRRGMNAVVSEDGTAARVFSGYPIKFGGKSGTAQLGRGKNDNGLFVAFAPYDDPEIAICVVGEGGGSGTAMSYAVRDILDAYFTGEQGADNISPNYSLLK